jgi:hypothetical protein
MAEAVVMVVVVAVVVVHQVTEVVDPREVVLDRACVNVQAVAPLPVPVLAPNHRGGVLAPLGLEDEAICIVSIVVLFMPQSLIMVSRITQSKAMLQPSFA